MVHCPRQLIQNNKTNPIAELYPSPWQYMASDSDARSRYLLSEANTPRNLSDIAGLSHTMTNYDCSA